LTPQKRYVYMYVFTADWFLQSHLYNWARADKVLIKLSDRALT
jgi:hypothetical protein